MKFSDIDVVIESAMQGETVACRRGCSWCCHQLVVLTCREDARAILAAARARLDAGEFAAFESLVRAQAAAIAAQGHEAAQAGRWTCPLLRAGECLVYDVRPVACRAVFSPDADCCRAMMQADSYAQLSAPHQRLATVIGDRAFRLQVAINDRRPVDGARELRDWLVELLDEARARSGSAPPGAAP